MTVYELSKTDGFSAVTVSDGTRKIEGAYCGDLLSWVMGRAQSGNAWITIMSNMNILAVASLADVSCIVIAEGVSLESDIIKTAEAKKINILSTTFGEYETAVKLGSLI